MLKPSVLILALALGAQARYIPDPIVRYKIDARLDAAAKTVKGHETIVWRNHSQDTIPDLQFHLYLNAFKNNYSTFMRESNGRHRTSDLPDPRKPINWGYQQVHSLKVDGADLTAKIEFIQPDDGNPHDQTVARVLLPKPIAPGQSVTIDIDFTSKLPHVFARTGFHDNFFLVAQWFPKPGVYEAAGERHRKQGGWNCHQFHSTTEFYADFGTFDVRLTVPADFEIGATGVQRTAQQNGNGTTTYNFYQEDVHDFAWTTQPKSQMLKLVRTFKADEQVSPAEIAEFAQKTGASPDDVRLTDVQVTLVTQREHRSQIDRHFRAAFAGIKWFGLMYGRYPYEALTVVDPPFGGLGAGGMEYPTLITAGTRYIAGDRQLSPEGVTVHEFGHQFWYAMVGNNEFEEAWLDEGFNTYSTGKVLEREYGPNYEYRRILEVPIPGSDWLQLPVPRYPWHGVGEVGIGQYFEYVPLYQRFGRSNFWANAQKDAMERDAWRMFDIGSYSTQAYSKPELTLRTLENLLQDQWPRIIRTYHQRWRFRHPDALDFVATVQEVSGRDMKWFFDQTLYGVGRLDYSVSFTTGPAPGWRGFFDQNGQPKFVYERENKDVAQLPSAMESEVTVYRREEMQFPVTVLVKFEGGAQAVEHWDGQYRWHKFKYFGMPRIVSAELDPGQQWDLEVPRTDNTWLADPVRLAPEKWYLRWVTWLQNIFYAFSFFS